MNEATAKALVSSFIGRLIKNETAFQLPGGIISTQEVIALQSLIGADDAEIEQRAAPAVIPSGTSQELNLSSLARKEVQRPNTLFCLDFGTAMSKAWASDGGLEHVYPATLAKEANQGSGFPIPSSLYINPDGTLFLGDAAYRQSLADAGSGDVATLKRYDNLKRELSEGVQANLDESPMPDGTNPTKIAFTKGDAITLYLAFITDLSVRSFERQMSRDPAIATVARHIKRRFAMPCFSRDRESWIKPWMEIAVLRAQIIADTLSGDWDRLRIEKVRAVLDEVRRLEELPRYLLDKTSSVKEPVASAAARFGEDGGSTEEDIFGEGAGRHFMLAIDAGAGTTDFAVFMVSRTKADDAYRYYTIENTIEGCTIAGNAVDRELRQLIVEDFKQKARHKQSLEDERFFDADLTSRLRRIKEEVLNSGTFRGPIGRDFVTSVTRDQFLGSDGMVALNKRLVQYRDDVIKKLPSSFTAPLKQHNQTLNLKVMLTGGTSRLPTFDALASGDATVDGLKVRFSKVQAQPRWLQRHGRQDVLDVFPQFAVAIGGSINDLPTDAGNVADFFGGTRHLGPIERFPTRGV